MGDKILVTEQKDDKNSEEQVNKKPLKFEKLTPVKLNETEMQGYKEALDFAFESDDLLNIALSGPYASGKTSIIKTYIDSKKINTAAISLAYFEANTQDNKEKSDSSEDKKDIKQKLIKENNQRIRELMLERKIINQLIHQIEPDKIPDTEFKIKYEPNKREVINWTIIITCIVLFFAYFGQNWFLKVFGTSYVVLTIIFITTILTTGFLIYKLVETQSRKSIIQKLKIFDTELDISGSRKDESYFDKYLDEIIYILERSEVKAIIFEDIDRYDDNLILSKLRELNCIYNRKQKDNNKKIKFIYLIKDEMFISKDRTKFFDYIIPVIPVIDSANSLSKINEIFKQGGIDKDFKDSTFLYDLSLYLDDIRLIKNIYNEYVIYRTKLRLFDKAEITWLKREKLLAMITYKNLFPKDFAETRLGHGRGVIHRIIESFSSIEKELRDKRIKKISEEIDLIEKDIEEVESEWLEDVIELMCLYIKLPSGEFYLSKENSNVRVARSNLSNIDVVKMLSLDKYKAYTNNNVYNNGLDNLEQYFKDLDQNDEYIRRKVYLENGKEDYINKKNNQIQQKEREKIQPSTHRKIIDIIDEQEKFGDTIDNLFKRHIKIFENLEGVEKEYKSIKDSPYFSVLQYFIKRGYIDEHYSDYMSFFYEGGLHRNDTQFIRHIAEHKETSWNLIIYNPEILLNSSRLVEGHFHNEYILNFSLLDYLIAHKHIFLSSFIKTLGRTENIKFIDEYLFRQKEIIEEGLLEEKDCINKIANLVTFIDYINKVWLLFWTETSFDARYYLYLSFQRVDKEILRNMNKDRKLVKFINEREDFLDIDDKQSWVFNLETTELAFKQLDLTVKSIEASRKELFELVYKHNLYEVNLTNINYILSEVYNLENYKSHYLQTIYSLSDKPICKFLEAYPNVFVDFLLSEEIPVFDDNEETVINILNNKEVDLGYRIEYTKKIKVIIKDLSLINQKKIWDVLLENKKIAYSAKNITYYFLNYNVQEEERNFNNILVDFINSSKEFIKSDQANLKNILTEQEQSTFFINTVKNNNIDNNKYKMMLQWFNQTVKNFNFLDLDKEKVSILIQQGVVKLGEEQDLKYLRDNYPNNIIELIVKNFDGYINKIKSNLQAIEEKKKNIKPNQSLVLPETLFNKDELKILLSEDITDDQKLVLIDLTKESISLNGLKISEKVKEYILDNNFDKNDLGYISSSKYYNASGESHKEKIKQICLNYFDDFLKLSIIAYDLLVVLLKEEDLGINKKYELLANILDKLNAKQAYNCFCILEGYLSEEEKEKKEFSKVFTGKRRVFESSHLNLRITNIIVQKKWGSISDKNDEGKSFRINGKYLV